MAFMAINVADQTATMPSPQLGAEMSEDQSIDFWFTTGSTYTYPTVSRLHKVEAASGVSFRWRPFNARAIMQEMDNIPFATKPIKLATCGVTSSDVHRSTGFQSTCQRHIR